MGYNFNEIRLQLHRIFNTRKLTILHSISIQSSQKSHPLWVTPLYEEKAFSIILCTAICAAKKMGIKCNTSIFVLYHTAFILNRIIVESLNDCHQNLK